MPDNEGAADKLKDRALGPAADEFGKALAPAGKQAGELASHISQKLIGVVSACVFGAEQVIGWVQAEVTNRLKDIPKEKITDANPRIAVPSVQALTYSMGEEHIREMFANLLSADMNIDLKAGAHPAFVENIKQMTSADAKVLNALRAHPAIVFRARLGSVERWRELELSYSFQVEGMPAAQVTTSISNLERLGLVRTKTDEHPDLDVADTISEQLTAKHQPIAQTVAELRTQFEAIPKPNPNAATQLKALPAAAIFVSRDGIFLTPIGRQFIRVCLSKGTSPQVEEENAPADGSTGA